MRTTKLLLVAAASLAQVVPALAQQPAHPKPATTAQTKPDTTKKAPPKVAAPRPAAVAAAPKGKASTRLHGPKASTGGKRSTRSKPDSTGHSH